MISCLPRSSCALTLSALLILVAGCTNSAEVPLEYAEDILWSGEDLGATELAGAHLQDDIALVRSEGTLAAIDLTTGHSQWSADEGEPLLGGNGAVVHQGRAGDARQLVVRDVGEGDWEVLVPYRTPAGELPADDASMHLVEYDYGVAALAGADGRVRWMSEPMVQGQPITEHPETRPLHAAGDTVVVASNGGGEVETMTTWAIDADTGQTRWTEENLWPSALSGGVVTVQEVIDGSTPWSGEGPEPEGTVAALNTDDGEPAWDLSEEFDTSLVDVASGEYVVVRGTAPGTDEDRTVVVSARTGEIVEEIGSFHLCNASQRLIACGVHGELVTYQTDDPELVSQAWEPFADEPGSWNILGVFEETIAVESAGSSQVPPRAFDAQGSVRAEELPGMPADLSEKYGIFCRGTDCDVYAADPDLQPDRHDEPAVEAFDLADPLWDQETFHAHTDEQLSTVIDVELVHDVVVVHGEAPEDEDYPTLVAEAATGEVRWALDESQRSREYDGQQLQLQSSAFSGPAIGEDGDNWWMLVPAESSQESGLAALDGATGELAWFLPLAGPDERVSVGPAEHGYAAVRIFDENTSSTSIIALQDGQELWRLPDSQPVTLTEQSVMVRDLQPGDDQQVNGLSLLGLDSAEENRWSLEHQDADRAIVTSGEGLVLVAGMDGTVILDAASGAELTSIARRLSDCGAHDGALLCGSRPLSDWNRAVAPVRIETSEDRVEVRELRNASISGVTGSYAGRYFIGPEFNENAEFTVDENGLVVDQNLPGVFQQVNDDGLAVFFQDEHLVDLHWEVRQLE